MAREKQASWVLSAEEVILQLGSDRIEGLSQHEAVKRRGLEGPNELPKKAGPSAWHLFARQFSSLIVWLLIGAAIIAQFLGEGVDAGAILAIVILNAVLGFAQEYRANRSLEALQKLTEPMARVKRDGQVKLLPARELVRGDLVILESGDRVPADGRLFYAANFTTQESILTGESLPVEKEVQPLTQEKLAIGDRSNMVYMGTLVLTGKAEMVITESGLKTEIGQIATLLQQEPKSITPLQRELTHLGSRLVWFCLLIVAGVWLLGFLRGYSPVSLLLTALSLAVAAIPEGLPAVVTISLSVGVRRMVKRQALLRRLSSVETLGCTSVICTDKTGTLTLNQMTVEKIWGERKQVIRIGALCSNATLSAEGMGTGDPTEVALLRASRQEGLEEEIAPLLAEEPFDSDRKWMSMLRKTGNKTTLFVKGAPDRLLDRCSSIEDAGNIYELNREWRDKIGKIQADWSSEGFRVLAVAYKSCAQLEEREWIFAGLIALRDPPREEVRDAVKRCKQAGIRVVMITGDHLLTAEAIGKEIGLKGESITGDDLDQMSDQQLLARIDQIVIYARTCAAHKLRIVRAWKEKGRIVAMTGDGVNDAPAMQSANIGIAMGITGSDVTKETADLLLLDDNFTSIVNAVEEGRCIYSNIAKFVDYLLSSNISEILVIVFALLIGFQYGGEAFLPLLPVQILWMNFITDGFPSIALAVDPLDPKAMHRPPRSPEHRLMNPSFIKLLSLISLLITLGTLITCWVGLKISPSHAQSMTVTTLVVLQLVRVQMIRKQFGIPFLKNPWIFYSLTGSLLLQVLILYVPLFQPLFGTTGLYWTDWVWIVGCSIVLWVAGNALSEKFFAHKAKSGSL